MAKAHIEMPDGTNIRLEGTPDEIAAILKDAKLNAKPSSAKGKTSAKAKAKLVTLPSLLTGLKDEGFFKKPKLLGEIQTRLADLGHNYPLTQLSGPMRKLARDRIVRRFKQNGKYVYAQ
jgi:hypothetical protein